MKLRRNLRVARRLALGVALLPVLAVGVAAQVAVVGPLFKKNMGIQRLSYAAMRRLFGIRVEFNEKSAPIVNHWPTWFLGNHQSQADIIVLGSVLNAAFAGKGTFMQNRFVAPVGRSVHYIGLRRVAKDDPDFAKFQKQAHGKVCKNFNESRSLITFQEGTTTDGAALKRFRGGLLRALFTKQGRGKDGETIFLDRTPLVQAVGIKVKSVEGVSAEGRDDLRHYYSHYTSLDGIKRILTRMGTKEIVVELNVSDPLYPEDFEDEKALANAAAEYIRAYAYPHQTEIAPASIPNVDHPAGHGAPKASAKPRL